jgi:rhodanese-related sulfurtransferase
MIKSLSLSALTLSLIASASQAVLAADPSDELFELDRLQVNITPSLSHIKVPHNGEDVLLMRHQDALHKIEPPYDLTSRACPPFCIQAMQLAPGVETLGELELIDYVRRIAEGEENLMLIDSRTQEWVKRGGTIPGAENIPYKKLLPSETKASEIIEILELEFNAARKDGLWDFSGAKTLVFFCNGPWCGQSPANIRSLLKLGYPAHKIKWYRGGLQAWEQFGLTTVKE